LTVALNGDDRGIDGGDMLRYREAPAGLARRGVCGHGDAVIVTVR
jgi:hypothetical protein